MTEPLELPKWAGSTRKERLVEASISLLVSILLGLACYWLFVLSLELFSFSNRMAPNLIAWLGAVMFGVLMMILAAVAGCTMVGVWFMRMRTNPDQGTPPTPSLYIKPTGPTAP